MKASKRQMPWPPKRLGTLESNLDRLMEAVSAGSSRDVDDQIWLTRFLVVRACGYLEQVMHETVVSHLEAVSYGRARSFAMSWLERSRSPSTNNILRLLGRMDPEMRTEMEEILSDNGNELARLISELVGKRNLIAHGENEGIGSQKALELARTSKQVANWFIRRLDPSSSHSHNLRE